MTDEVRQVYRDRLPSTQELALSWAREGVGVGSYVAAGEQTAGRGQAGRAWHSPPGGLYLSAVLPAPEARLGWLSLSAGLALRDLLLFEGASSLWVKWPNDLVVAPTPRSPGPRKLAGILVDVLSIPSGPSRAVVGVGLNVRRPVGRPPPGLQERMAFLAEGNGAAMEPRELIPKVLSALRAACEGLQDPGTLDNIPDRLTGALWGVGCRIDAPEGPGTFLGVDASGAARIQLAKGETRSVLPGSLTWEAP
jgi:BirA family biotin operon repressor/biotin-[acetyl-CoA-carboxylase] ligase